MFDDDFERLFAIFSVCTILIALFTLVALCVP